MRTFKKAYLEITNVCNLSCSFCPGSGRAQGFLSPERFAILARRLRPHTQFLYLHLMGEPLLHPQLSELLSIAAELDFQVMITTNGTLLSQRGALLLDFPAVRKVSISLHSYQGNQLDTTLSEYLAPCLSFARQLAGQGKHCALRLWNLDTDGAPPEDNFNHTIMQQLEQAFPRPWQSGHRGITLADHIYLEMAERFDWPDLHAPESDTRFCHGLRDQIGVLWDGTVVPCCLDHEGDIPLGNLFEQPLAAILDSPRAWAIYQGFSERRPSEALCRRCGFSTRFS